MNFFAMTQRLRTHRWFGFVFGFFAVLAAYAIRLYLGAEALQFPFVIFIPFVVLTTFLGGLLPGIAAAIASGVIADLTLIAPAGSIWPTWPDGWTAMFFYVLTVGVDIALIQGMVTSYLRAEAAERDLRLLNERLEQTVEARTRERDRVWTNSRDLLMVIGTDGKFRAVSPAWTVVLGHTPQEVVDRSLLEFIHAEDVERVQSGLQSAAAGRDLTDFENRYCHKDGSARWISWHTSAEGELIYAYGRDITARKQAEVELARAQDTLRQTQKMDAMGQLTGGIAHDFNNMLAIVIGSLDVASRRLQRGESDIERHLESARAGAMRAATLTQRLLAFSRQSPLSPRILNLNELVASMSELLRRTLGERIGLETVLAGGLWPSYVDPNQLESAILNLAVNARDAMPDGGNLTIETANSHLDDRYVAREVGLNPGQYVMIAVTDGGSGIAPDILEKVFDPFFTTKPIGKGTGLGLSMVYGFAKQSGGHVRIYSEVGTGTTVKLYIPRYFGSGEKPDSSYLETMRPTPPSRAETVLVVEDEDRVRQMSCEALRELGYTVYEAASGEQALQMFDSLGQVDVLFTDVVMAGMTGRQLADALLRRAPHLKVLFTTGYTKNAVVHNGVLDPGVAFLSKPFTVEALAVKLRATLDV